MSLGGIIVAALTLLSFLLFLLTYRAKVILWLDSMAVAKANRAGEGARESAGDRAGTGFRDGARDVPGGRAEARVGLDEAEIQKRTLASQGFYVIEALSLAAAFYLLSVCLSILGVVGWELWIFPLATCVFVTLILAPALLREAEHRSRSTARDAGAAEATRVAPKGEAGRFIAPRAPRATFFPEVILRPAERTYALLTGWGTVRGEVKESLRREVIGSMRGESSRAEPSRGKMAHGKMVQGKAAKGKMTAESTHWKNVLDLLLRLRERRVSEVMVSRVDMVCAEETSTGSDVAELVKEAAYTRIPVFSRTLDTITGYVTAKDVVIRLHQGGSADVVSSIARKPVYVLSDDTIEHALKEMQNARVTLAIVTEPSGSTAGLVTGEDILEEVVGDFYEDYEPDEPAYQVIDDRTAIVRANVALGDLREILGGAPSLPPSDLKLTLGEYVRHRLGVEPSRGERVSDDVFSYSVARTIGKEVWSFRVEKRK